jgi:hypothetical protein
MDKILSGDPLIMLKKTASIFAALALSVSLASSAFAVFNDFNLVRVVSDSSGGSTLEIATDLGNITSLSALTNTTVGGGMDAFTLFNSAPFNNLSVNYFAVSRTSVLNGTMYIGANTTTVPLTPGVSQIQNKLAATVPLTSPISVNRYYAGLPLAPGSTATVIANNIAAGSFGAMFGSTTLGNYAGYAVNFTTNANLKLTNLATVPVPMTVWQFGNGTNMALPATGVKILTLTTNADGSTTINPTYTVTATAGVNGSLDAATPSPLTAAMNATPVFTFNAANGFYISSISGCNGTAFTNSDPAVVSQAYTAGPISANCTVTAGFAASAAKTDQTTPVTVTAPAGASYAQAGLSAVASGGNGSGAYSYSAGTSTACSVDVATGALTIASGIGSCSITATRAGDATFNASAVSAAALVAISKAVPTITWFSPNPISYGTALSATQLNAVAYVPGILTYSPLSGSVPAIGNQVLSVSFTPTDAVNYAPANTVVSITVTPTVQISGNVTTFSTLLGLIPTITTDSTIQLRDVYTTTTPEALLFNNGFIVTINGGLDAGWLPTANLTTVKGTLTVQSGKLIVSRLIIKQP